MRFNVQVKKPGTKSSAYGSHNAPTELPSFMLVHNDGWNDYGAYTWFSLFYYDVNGISNYVGDLKIMHDEETDTIKKLGDSFEDPLDSHFCSLGLDTSFYIRLVDSFDKSTISEILRYLRDCTFNSRVKEEFLNHPTFTGSLLRDMTAQEAIKEAEFILNDDDPKSAYTFSFEYHPDYDTGKKATWDLSFNQGSPSYLRTVGIIGENGVGKSMLLTSLVKALLEKEKPELLTKMPHFQSCVAIYSSSRDGLGKIKSNNPNMEYVRCSLRQHEEATFEKMLGAIEGDIMKRPILHGRSVTRLYLETLREHVGERFVKDLFIIDSSDLSDEKFELNRDRLRWLVGILSSGQLQIFELITHLYAHIHLSSLVVFDEPEVHMHPSLIMNFMPLLNRLLREFQSFSIICTHTPLVIRELVQKNVYRMSMIEDGTPHIVPVAFRTFGEDISVLYRNIFEYDEKRSLFRHSIKQMVLKIKHEWMFKKNKNRADYIEAITAFLEKDMELGLSGRMAIRDIVYELIEEEEKYEES